MPDGLWVQRLPIYIYGEIGFVKTAVKLLVGKAEPMQLRESAGIFQWTKGHKLFLLCLDLSFDNTKEKSEKREQSRASGTIVRKIIA